MYIGIDVVGKRKCLPKGGYGLAGESYKLNKDKEAKNTRR